MSKHQHSHQSHGVEAEADLVREDLAEVTEGESGVKTRPVDVLQHQAQSHGEAHRGGSIETQLREAQDKIAGLEAELKLEKEKALRVMADTENFKRRKEQEKEEFCTFANEKLIKELLPVLDSFDYAVLHANDEKSQEKKETIIEGFMLIQKQLHRFLEKFDVCPIECLNGPFDPHQHQAMMQEPRDDVPADIVVKEMQKGYTYHKRVLRPSMVAVSTKPE